MICKILTVDGVSLFTKRNKIEEYLNSSFNYTTRTIIAFRPDVILK